MEQRIDKCVLPNGMVVLGEPMPGVESVAFDFMLPGGAAWMPPGYGGAANVISEWVFRGAGTRNSRQLGDALDGLGVQRSSSIGSAHLYLGGALESSNLAQALALHADVILEPHLTDEQFEPARQLIIEELQSLDDEPRQKVMIELRKRFYPDPLGRSNMGELDELQSLTAAKVRELVGAYRDVQQTILAEHALHLPADGERVRPPSAAAVERDRNRREGARLHAYSQRGRPGPHWADDADGAVRRRDVL